MALHNYSVPYQVTPSQPPSFYPLPPHRTPQVQVQGYNYPHPDTPFDEEDYDNPQNQRGVNNGYNPSSTKRPQSFQPQSFQPQKVQHTIHPIIDYDYLDDPVLPVAPIQGPIVIKNGTVPVVPLYSYPTINNGSFVQIPILWTALSVALGLELRGEYIRGVPCIKKNFQLFCPTAGNTYPTDRIDLFIDENKALMKRMYGEFDMRLDLDGGPPSPRGVKKKRSTPGVPDLHFDPEGDPLRGTESFASKIRNPRQSFRNNQSSESGRIDSCQSKVEIITPYWASNSAGKVRAIVNTQHFEQAIHQEVCAKTRTNRCAGDCGCEQKYKWHRLLAYDPDNDCKGIFMDWFLFPSCCVCRCNP